MPTIISWPKKQKIENLLNKKSRIDLPLSRLNMISWPHKKLSNLLRVKKKSKLPRKLKLKHNLRCKMLGMRKRRLKMKRKLLPNRDLLMKLELNLQRAMLISLLPIKLPPKLKQRLSRMLLMQQRKRLTKNLHWQRLKQRQLLMLSRKLSKKI